MKKSTLSLALLITLAVSQGAEAQSVGSIQSSAIGQTVAPMSGLTSEISRAQAAESALQATANAALPAASAGPLATQAGASPSAAVTGALGYTPLNPSGGDSSYTTVIAQGATMAAHLQDRFAQRYNAVLDFGAKGDAVQISVSANFAARMRGRRRGFVMVAVRDQFSRVIQPREKRVC